VEGIGHFALGVREQGNLNVPGLREIRKDLLLLAGDPRDFEAFLGEVCLGLTQLDQLSFAAASPLSGFVEEKDKAFGASQIGEIASLAKLVFEGKRGHMGADCQRRWVRRRLELLRLQRSTDC
jgi:hypothetical protein